MMVEISVFRCDKRLKEKRWDVAKMNVRPVFYKELIDRLAIGRDNAGRDFGMGRFELFESGQAALHVPPDKGQEQYQRGDEEKENSAFRTSHSVSGQTNAIQSFKICEMGSVVRKSQKLCRMLLWHDLVFEK
jgi:hypothetical protein